MTLLLAMLVLGCLIAPIAYERQKAQRYKAEVEKLKALGGEIAYDDARPKRSDLVAAVLGDNRFENMTSIRFPPYSSIKDDDLRILDQFSYLKWVRLDETRVNDAALLHLKDCRELKLLSLYGTRVSDAGMVHLADMKNLEELWLSKTDVSDAGVLQLGKLAKLKSLALHRTNVTDAGAEELHKALPNCKINY
jgi:Leucine-rich repeat (LRR) protein